MPNPEGFKNGLDGLEAVLQKPENVLSAKVRKSLANRQKKIEKLLGELCSAQTPEALDELIQKRALLEEMVELLVKQAHVLETETKDTSLSQPYKESVIATGEFGKQAMDKILRKESFDVAEAIKPLQTLIRSAWEKKTVASTSLASPNHADTSAPVADVVEPTGTVETGEEATQPEKAPTFDDLNDLSSIIARLQEVGELETGIEPIKGKEQLWKNSEVADLITQRSADFRGMKTEPKRLYRNATEFTKIFSSRSLREAVRRSFVTEGFLPAPVKVDKPANTVPEAGAEGKKEEPPVFDDINTVEALTERLRDTEKWETAIEWASGYRPRPVSNKEIADTLRARVAELEAMQKANNPKVEQRTEEFVTAFTNPSLREAVRRSLVAKGLLTARAVPPSQMTPQNQVEAGQAGQTQAEVSPEYGPLLETVFEKLKNSPAIGAIREKQLVTVKGPLIEKGVRDLVRDFRSEGFKKLSKEKQKGEILTAIETLTTNEDVRADLRDAFAEMELLEGGARSPEGKYMLDEKRRLAFRKAEEREGNSSAKYLEPEELDPRLMKRKKGQTLPSIPANHQRGFVPRVATGGLFKYTSGITEGSHIPKVTHADLNPPVEQRQTISTPAERIRDIHIPADAVARRELFDAFQAKSVVDVDASMREATAILKAIETSFARQIEKETREGKDTSLENELKERVVRLKETAEFASAQSQIAKVSFLNEAFPEQMRNILGQELGGRWRGGSTWTSPSSGRKGTETKGVVTGTAEVSKPKAETTTHTFTESQRAEAHRRFLARFKK